jgi:hypothetical protein
MWGMIPMIINAISSMKQGQGQQQQQQQPAQMGIANNRSMGNGMGMHQQSKFQVSPLLGSYGGFNFSGGFDNSSLFPKSASSFNDFQQFR